MTEGGSRPRGDGVLARLAATARERQVATFLVLAFAWTWGTDLVVSALTGPNPSILVNIPRTWGPPLAAVAVTWLSGGDVREWFREVADWRVRPRWFLVALALPLVVEDLPVLAYALGGGSASFPNHPLGLYLLNFVGVLLLAGSLEEFGWRGFVQPRLQERYSALAAAVGIGVVWACWHLPLFVRNPEVYNGFPSYLLVLVCESVIYAWLYNGSGGSVLPVMVIHAAGNLPSLFAASGDPGGLAGTVVDWYFPTVYVVVALGVVAVHGARYLAPTRPDPPVPGRTDAPE